MRDWIASAMKNYKGSDMDITTPRPMLNSPVHEGTADAELLFKRPMNFTRPMLNSPTHGTAAGDAFYARVVRRVAAWHDSPVVIDKILAEMQERPDFYEEMMRQEDPRCNCSICRNIH
jgi:hypothetical protein